MAHKMTAEEFLIVVSELRERNWDTQDGQPPFAGVDLRWTNLSGADLSGADLRNADLRWTNLSRVDLSETKLNGAGLSGANLSGANLIGADLSGADLRWTDLNGANLNGADLDWADLRNADLRWAKTANATLGGALLSYPIGMSKSNHDVSKKRNYDHWRIGCWSGTTAKTVERIVTEKSGTARVSYLARMLSFAVDMTPEQIALVNESLQRAITENEHHDRRND